MKNKRLRLQTILEKTLNSKNVYFQPPTGVKMHYPAIVYSRNNITNSYANNNVYQQKVAYSVTVIDKNPDSNIVEAVSNLPLCRFNRHYTADGLNHDVFTLYF